MRTFLSLSILALLALNPLYARAVLSSEAQTAAMLCVFHMGRADGIALTGAAEALQMQASCPAKQVQAFADYVHLQTCVTYENAKSQCDSALASGSITQLPVELSVLGRKCENYEEKLVESEIASRDLSACEKMGARLVAYFDAMNDALKAFENRKAEKLEVVRHLGPILCREYEEAVRKCGRPKLVEISGEAVSLVEGLCRAAANDK